MSGFTSFASGGGAVGNASTTLDPSTEVTISSHATLAHTKGNASAALINGTANAWSALRIYLYSANNAARRFLVDFSLDNGATWAIPDLFVYPGSSSTGAGARFDIPLAVPAGSIIKARCQTDTTAQSTVKAFIEGVVASPARPPGFATFAPINTIDTANTLPSSVEVTLNGTWFKLGTTAHAYSAVLAAGSQATNAAASQNLHLAIGTGPASSEVEVARVVMATGASAPAIRGTASVVEPIAIASGVDLSVKVENAVTPTDAIRVGLYGLR